MTKQEFIGKELNRTMKDHGLAYGMPYFNLLAEKTEEAEAKWKKVKHKYKKPTKTKKK
jgi:hypothetical protein